MLYMNKKMKKKLNRIRMGDRIEYLNNIKIRPPEFVELSGCILLKDEHRTLKEDEVESTLLNNYKGDRTWLESSFNEFLAYNYVRIDEMKPIEQLSSAIEIVDLLAINLSKVFPKYKFHIVVIYDNHYCNLRFYRVREGERPWIDIKSIENSSDAIAIRAI